MDKLCKDFAICVIREIGLEVDSKHRIIDSDSGDLILYKGKILKFNSIGYALVDKTEMEFNPLMNIDLMQKMFGYYAEKLEEEEERHISYIVIESEPYKRSAGVAKCIIDDNIKIVSKRYENNDSVKYLDLITKINDNHRDKYDYSKFDIPLTTIE